MIAGRNGASGYKGRGFGEVPGPNASAREQYIYEVYKQFLNREPESGAISGWAATPYTNLEIYNQIKNSPEALLVQKAQEAQLTPEQLAHGRRQRELEAASAKQWEQSQAEAARINELLAQQQAWDAANRANAASQEAFRIQREKDLIIQRQWEIDDANARAQSAALIASLTQRANQTYASVLPVSDYTATDFEQLMQDAAKVKPGVIQNLFPDTAKTGGNGTGANTASKPVVDTAAVGAGAGDGTGLDVMGWAVPKSLDFNDPVVMIGAGVAGLVVAMLVFRK